MVNTLVINCFNFIKLVSKLTLKNSGQPTITRYSVIMFMLVVVDCEFRNLELRIDNINEIKIEYLLYIKICFKNTLLHNYYLLLKMFEITIAIVIKSYYQRQQKLTVPNLN